MFGYQKSIVVCLLAACVALALSTSAPANVNFVVPGSPPTSPLAFETAANWSAPTYSPMPVAGPELTPPGKDSTFFIVGLNG